MKDMGWKAIVSLILIALGFVAIVLGWSGAAGVACPDCQIPYLLSGGALGLGLIGVGVVLLAFESMRRSRVHLEGKLDELIEAVRGGIAPGAFETTQVKKAAPQSLNGMVIVGRSSFHRPGCRLVEGKEELDYASTEDAVARGLSPCRVCEPMKIGAR